MASCRRRQGPRLRVLRKRPRWRRRVRPPHPHPHPRILHRCLRPYSRRNQCPHLCLCSPPPTSLLNTRSRADEQVLHLKMLELQGLGLCSFTVPANAGTLRKISDEALYKPLTSTSTNVGTHVGKKFPLIIMPHKTREPRGINAVISNIF